MIGEMAEARYEGMADWYDSFFEYYGEASSSAGHLKRLLGPGSGWCLDLGSGTGIHFEAITSTGREVVGVDISPDMLRVAQKRSPHLFLADVARLPFADESFDTVVSTYLHTDIDDLAPVFREAKRVLRAEGRLVYLGIHPCFTGQFVEYDRKTWTRIIHSGYLDAGWHFDSPHFSEQGVRRKVGYRHVPMSELVGAVLESGLRLEKLEELRGDEPRDETPARLALIARKEVVDRGGSLKP